VVVQVGTQGERWTQVAVDALREGFRLRRAGATDSAFPESWPPALEGHAHHMLGLLLSSHCYGSHSARTLHCIRARTLHCIRARTLLTVPCALCVCCSSHPKEPKENSQLGAAREAFLAAIRLVPEHTPYEDALKEVDEAIEKRRAALDGSKQEL
jgi:hypothetical protein